MILINSFADLLNHVQKHIAHDRYNHNALHNEFVYFWEEREAISIKTEEDQFVFLAPDNNAIEFRRIFADKVPCSIIEGNLLKIGKSLVIYLGNLK